MNTINISLPAELKNQAENLIDYGHYASFSDLVRTAIRKLLEESRYDSLVDEALADHRAGKTTILETRRDISRYVHDSVKK